MRDLPELIEMEFAPIVRALRDAGYRIVHEDDGVPGAVSAEGEGYRPCRHGNPTCPCQDGDPCHYEGPDAMECPYDGCPHHPEERP